MIITDKEVIKNLKTFEDIKKKMQTEINRRKTGNKKVKLNQSDEMEQEIKELKKTMDEKKIIIMREKQKEK